MLRPKPLLFLPARIGSGQGIKALENPLDRISRHTGSGVVDRDHRPVIGAERDPDGAARRRVFDGVMHQVPERLVQQEFLPACASACV